MYKLNANFLTHFLNFGRYHFGCVHSTIPGPLSLRTSKSLLIFCVWAAARLCHHFWTTIRLCSKNLAKPHPKHILQTSSNTPRHTTGSGWRSHLSPVMSLTENLLASRYSPRIISGTLQPKNRSWCFDHFQPTLIDGRYCSTIQDGNPISCQSRHGPRFCRRRVTVQKSVVNAYQPKIGHQPITVQVS